MVQAFNIGGLPENPPTPVTTGQSNFSRGVISIVDESNLPRNALKQADNIFLIENGSPTVRPGIGWYGNAPDAAAIDGAAMFVDSADIVHLVVVSGGTVWRSVNDGADWAECTGATFTAGKKVDTEQANSALYLFNGWDNIVRYDGTTNLAVYTPLPTPTGVSAVETGMTGTTYKYYYRVSAVNDIGFTIASVAVEATCTFQRHEWGDTKFVTFTWNTVPGAKRYDIYVGMTAGEEQYIDYVEGEATLTYKDKGQAIEQPNIIAPDSNTTEGPRVADMALVGSRLYATGDRDNPYRIWISGAGRFIGQFASAWEAAYVDWQKGGQHKPVKVEDYRDGKGTPLATVWCRSTDGKGSILQGTLEAMTVGDVTFPVPNFYRLPGSRGTEAPHSVVNVLNDYMYYNSNAMFNLGSRAQFMNLLSTDEASANIRPNMKRIRRSAAHKIASHFQDARVYTSVPYESDDNNATIVFDTERKAWLPYAFTVGFERFFSYTDGNGDQHLLCWKPGDNRLSEISDQIDGDYGQAFQTTLVTGLISVNPKNRFDFLFAEEAEFEFAQPRGNINVEASGITRNDGFRKLGDRNIAPATTKASWTLDKWTENQWSYKDGAPKSYSEPSLKRYFTLQEEINAYQFRIHTETLESDYILRTLQINGTATDAGKPREWELFS